MDGPTFRSTRKFLGPSWLTSEGESELVGYTVDTLKDGAAERLRQGLLARFPQHDEKGLPGSDDALAAIGRDRRIVRGISEGGFSYASRLLSWLDDWKTAGNPFTLMSVLAAYCGPLPSFRTVDVRGNWYSRASTASGGALSVVLDQGNWDWDSSPDALARWSRFWVIIYPNSLWTQGPTWGAGGSTWGEPSRTWGSTATTEQVATIKSLVSDWKPAGTRCVNIIIAFDASSFDPTTLRDGTGLPDGTWGHWSKVTGDTKVAARLATARYWDGV